MSQVKERKYKKRRDKQALPFTEDSSSLADGKALKSNTRKSEDAPKGLDEVVPHTPDKVDLLTELAGSEVLIVYFAKLGSSQQDSMVDLDYLETLIQSGAKINYTDRFGQTVLHEVI